MNTIDRAAELLRKTEAELRTLLSQSAAAGDYAALTRLTALARQIADMCNSEHAATAHKGQPAGFESEGIRFGRRSAAERVPLRSRLKCRRKRAAAMGYPKFVRQRDDLVKIGWSRRGRKEYQHKAPRRILSLVADAVVAAASRAELFTTEDMMPLMDPHGKMEVPSYQVYVCLAWLRHIGLVEQKGRKGYTAGNVTSFVGEMVQQWDSLGFARGVKST